MTQDDIDKMAGAFVDEISDDLIAGKISEDEAGRKEKRVHEIAVHAAAVQRALMEPRNQKEADMLFSMVLRTHNTEQQMMASNLMGFYRVLAKYPYVDGRNEASVKFARQLVEMRYGEGLPFPFV